MIASQKLYLCSMSSKSRILFFLSAGLCLFIACSKDPLIPFDEPEKELRPDLPEVPFVYGTDTFPSYFNSPPLSFTNSIVEILHCNFSKRILPM